MASDVKFGSAGISIKEIDLSSPTPTSPSGIPAGIVSTSPKGPAFVPITVATFKEFMLKFGSSDGKKFGPLAVFNWLRNKQSATFVKVLGAGTGLKRTTSGNNQGSVASSGFLVNSQQPNDAGVLATNPYANTDGILGRTYFLGCFMSESKNSTFFSDAGLQGQSAVLAGITASIPIVRGVIFAASGVLPRLSASFFGTNTAPASTALGRDSTANGSITGTIILTEASVAKQEFVLLLNGHKGTDPSFPNVLTASFDMTAPNYFPSVLNRNPYKLQQAGHYLYAYWDVHPTITALTGTGLIHTVSGANGSQASVTGKEASAFITTGTLGHNAGSTTVPNWENFQDRYTAPKTPWIISQKFGGQSQNLFRIWSLDDGEYAHKRLKFSIENLAQSTDLTDQYGTFDLIVRSLDDLDTAQVVLEKYNGLSLNPSSDKYIAKVIGDQHLFYDWDIEEAGQKVTLEGNYPNKSNYIRVEISADVDNAVIDPTALPVGFRGFPHLTTSGTLGVTSPYSILNTQTSNQHSVTGVLHLAVQPPVPFRKNINDGTGATSASNPTYYWGVQFEHPTSVDVLNGGTLVNKSFEMGFGKYFPDFHTSYVNPLVSNNQGAADTAANGILDADRFNNNLFSLENIQVITASDTKADATNWVNSVYVRKGNISANEANKTRAWTVSDLTTPNRRFAKFSLFIQGGFDGVNIFDEDAATFTNTAVNEEMGSAGRGQANGPTVKSYLKALNVLGNTEDVSIDLLAIPGIRHPLITDSAVVVAESDRNDCLYLMDIEEYDVTNTLVTSSLQMPSVANTITSFNNRSTDSSFAAAYYPDVIMEDPITKTNVVIPSSVAALGAIALNDALGHPWFAPAGFARGVLKDVSSAKVKLSKGNLDSLYDAKINPIVAFPSSGPVVWGQKTLQNMHSALDRVNVRRMLIDIRRKIKNLGKTFIFEPNRASTLARFESDVRPIVARVQSLGGVDKFKVQIDTTTTTQSDIENNTIRGKIVLVPTKSIEFVELSFIVGSGISL